MSDYAAPLADMRFVLHELVGLEAVARLPGYEDATAELVDQVLDEAGKFAARVLAPLDQPGDREGARIENGVVGTPAGFRAAYAGFTAAGWNGLAADPADGGQGLPRLVAAAVSEMWQSANTSFALCPLLTQGATELLAAHGSDGQKRLFLEKLVSGAWTGTMCMTEPQAGSDIGALAARAVRQDGRYRLSGTKIFVSYGDHDLAENIVHMVLARYPDAPP